ncbi:MAG: branched-chain amino acid ABC transporter substrate-binding protein, partial [Alphaproteobacteria bacterium]
AFDSFILADGMIGQSLIDSIGAGLNGAIGTLPGSESKGAKMFLDVATAGGVDGDGPFRAESYDAAALIALAIQAGGSADRSSIQANMLAVANAPGEQILPGELGKALQILADGGEIDYQGATNVELIGPGEAAGSYKELEVMDGAFKTIKVH